MPKENKVGKITEKEVHFIADKVRQYQEQHIKYLTNYPQQNRSVENNRMVFTTSNNSNF